MMTDVSFAFLVTALPTEAIRTWRTYWIITQAPFWRKTKIISLDFDTNSHKIPYEVKVFMIIAFIMTAIKWKVKVEFIKSIPSQRSWNAFPNKIKLTFVLLMTKVFFCFKAKVDLKKSDKVHRFVLYCFGNQ